MEIQRPFRQCGYWKDPQQIKHLLLMQPFRIQQAKAAAEEINDAFNLAPLNDPNYHSVDPQDVAAMQTHLTTPEQQQLATL